MFSKKLADKKLKISILIDIRYLSIFDTYRYSILDVDTIDTSPKKGHFPIFMIFFFFSSRMNGNLGVPNVVMGTNFEELYLVILKSCLIFQQEDIEFNYHF